jgi:hypothetical protein
MLFSRRPRSRGRARAGHARTFVENLESRRLLSAAVWTGSGTDNNFSDANNWQGDVAPTAGQAVQFPAGIGKTAVVVDSNVTLGNIEFDAAYTLSSANTITLNGNISATSGASSISTPIALEANTVITVNVGAVLTVSGAISGAGFGISTGGAGVLDLSAPAESYTGSTVVNGGDLTDTANLASAVTLTSGSVYNASASIPSLSASGASIGAFSGSAAGTLTVANGFSLAAGSQDTFNAEIGGPGASSNVTVNAGQIALNNAVLQTSLLNTYSPAAGDVITLISNNTNNAISGTFQNLPEGASVNVGGDSFTISYVGGAGHDVTLTASSIGTAITVLSNRPAIYEGESVTLSALVSGANDSTPSSGSVTFYDNFLPLSPSDVTISSNGTASISTSNLTVGTNIITAQFSGGDVFGSSTSASTTVNVRQGRPPIVELTTASVTTHGVSVGASVTAVDTQVGSSVSSHRDLTYSWSVLHEPAGAKAPIFSANNNALASSVVIHFGKDGGYLFQCKVTNPEGNSAYTTVKALVIQKARNVRLVPANALVVAHHTEQYTATALDQFGHPMRALQNIAYFVESGGGSIDQTGLYLAGGTPGSVTIEATDQSLVATVDAEIID